MAAATADAAPPTAADADAAPPRLLIDKHTDFIVGFAKVCVKVDETVFFISFIVRG